VPETALLDSGVTSSPALSWPRVSAGPWWGPERHRPNDPDAPAGAPFTRLSTWPEDFVPEFRLMAVIEEVVVDRPSYEKAPPGDPGRFLDELTGCSVTTSGSAAVFFRPAVRGSRLSGPRRGGASDLFLEA